MTLPSTPANSWPAKLACLSAAIFAFASGGTNVLYGWQKGADLAGSLVWASVAGAVAIAFTLSWPAFPRSVDARQWARASLVLVGMALTGTYSVTAALGSAAGGRANAALAEEATTDARKKAQAAWDAAKAELDRLATEKPGDDIRSQIDAARDELTKIPATRPVAEIDVLLAAAARNPRRYGCTAINGSLAASCPKLEAERARAEQRDRLAGQIDRWTGEIAGAEKRHGEAREKAQTAMDRAAGQLTAGKPGKVANSDAVALAAFAAGLGFDIDAERINKLLALLAVLVVEMGSGLSLAIGIALTGAAPASGQPERVATAAEQPATPILNAPLTCLDTSAPRGVQTVQVSDSPASPVPTPGVEAILRANGGTIRTTMRRLGAQLGGVPAATVHSDLRRMAAAGLVRLRADSRGTHIELATATNSSLRLQQAEFGA